MTFMRHDKKVIMEKYKCEKNLVPIFEIVENLIEMDYWLYKFNLLKDNKEKKK